MAVTVLLVDDNQEFLDVLSERLIIRGMEVATVASGKAALERLRTEAFDVIVLDLQMPEMDGLEVLEQLAAGHPNQKIILLTGHATVARGVQAMKLGAADVLEKPVDIRELVERINTVASQQTIRVPIATSSASSAAKGETSGWLGSLRRLLSKKEPS